MSISKLGLPESSRRDTLEFGLGPVLRAIETYPKLHSINCSMLFWKGGTVGRDLMLYANTLKNLKVHI